MNKPEPLFPTVAACPVCGKRTRLKWESPKQLPRGVERIAVLNCHSCGKTYLRAVGTPEGIDALAQLLRAQHQHEHHHDHGEPRILGRTERYAYIEMPAH
jgi:hypothetical protein